MASLVAAAASPLLEATTTATSCSGAIAIRTKKVPPRPAPTCPVGISALLGGGRVGSGPVPAETGSRAEEAHPAATTRATASRQH